MKKKELQIPKTLFRTATFDKSAINDAERTVEMSISSDAPYQRYFGNEILDHSAKSVKMDRLKAGAPLLFNHDRNAHIGRIVAATSDGKNLRIKAQFGNSALAQEKFKDVQDGILRETSVGYQVNRMVLESEDEKEGDTYRVTDWMPYEGSLVTIPADASVGVGRTDEDGTKTIFVENKKSIDEVNNPDDNAQNEKESMKFKSRKFLESDTGGNGSSGSSTIDVVAERKSAQVAERERVKKINGYVDGFKIEAMKPTVLKLARKAMEDGMDFDAFRAMVLDNWDGAQRVEAQDLNPEIGMSKKDLKDYSLTKVMLECGRPNGAPTGLEKECSDAQAKKLNKRPDGFYLPEDWSRRGMDEIHGLNQKQAGEQLDIARAMLALQVRTLTAGNFASAGALIGTELMASSFVELLRNKALIMSLGPTHLGGLVGNIAIPKQVGGATAYWLAEGASVTAADQTFAQVGMTPHRLAAQTAYDKQLLAQSTPSVEMLVRNDLALVMAIKKDLACISGSGASGEPLGITNTAGVQTVTFGAAADWAHVLSFETKLAQQNADQTGQPVWLTTPAVRGKWKQITKIATSQYSDFLWVNGQANGYDGHVTNQVASDLVLFFVPSELVVADWAGIDVVVNPYSLDSSGQIRVTITQWTDNAVRHPSAFVNSTDSGAQ